MRRNPWWYLVIMVVVGGIVVWLDKPFQSNGGDRLTDPLFQNLSVSDVSRLEVEHILDGLLLEKKEGTWLAWNMPTAVQKELSKAGGDQPAAVAIDADGEKITKALEMLVGLRGESLVSRSPEQYAVYEVAAGVGTHVRLYDDAGEKMASLIIGKMGPDYMSTYIRANDAPEVYQIKGSLAGYFIPKVDEWKAPSAWKKMRESVH